MKTEKSIEKKFTIKKDKITILDKAALLIRMLIIVAIGIVFVTQKMYIMTTADGDIFSYNRIIKFAVIGIVVIILPLFQLQMPKQFKPVEVIIAFGEIGVAVLAANYLSETIHGISFRSLSDISQKYALVLVFCLFLFFMVLTCRRKISVVLAILVPVIFSLSNYYTFSFRGDPIMASDLYCLGTALNVVAGYKFFVTYEIVKVVLLILFLIAFLQFLPKEEWRPKKWIRLGFSVVSIAIIVTSLYVVCYSRIPLDRDNIYVKNFNRYKSYKRFGEVLTFARSFYYLRVDKPEDYNAEKLDETAQNYQSDDAVLTKDGKKVNVIVIMNEALTDLTVDGDLKLSEDNMPYLRSLADQPNSTFGSLYVNVFGGHTADTEYEFLTGNTMAYLPESSVPYVLYVNKDQPSYTWNLRSLKYSGLDAFHPFRRSGYRRYTAYPYLGFEDFISLETIQDELTAKDYVREFASDEFDFSKIIQLYEESKKDSSDPFYIFNVTMQNHSGYSKDYDNFNQDISLLGEESSMKDVQRYVNLVKYTDEAFKTLTDYFSKVDEPTLIVMFGDHQPKLQGKFYKQLIGKSDDELEGEDKLTKYRTALVTWANFDYNKNGEYTDVLSKISANYLNTVVDDIADIPETGYQKYLSDLHEELPVLTLNGYLDKDGNYYGLNDKDSPYYDELQIYKNFVYNNQFDSGNYPSDFYYLNENSN